MGADVILAADEATICFPESSLRSCVRACVRACVYTCEHEYVCATQALASFPAPAALCCSPVRKCICAYLHTHVRARGAHGAVRICGDMRVVRAVYAVLA